MAPDKWDPVISALSDRVNHHEVQLAQHEHMFGELNRNSERIEEAASNLGTKIETIAKDFSVKLEDVVKEFRDAMGWRNTIKDVAFVMLFIFCVYQWIHGNPSVPPFLK